VRDVGTQCLRVALAGAMTAAKLLDSAISRNGAVGAERSGLMRVGDHVWVNRLGDRKRGMEGVVTDVLDTEDNPMVRVAFYFHVVPDWFRGSAWFRADDLVVLSAVDCLGKLVSADESLT